MKLKSILLMAAASVAMCVQAQQVIVSPTPQSITWGSKAYASEGATYKLVGTPDAINSELISSCFSPVANGKITLTVGKKGDDAVKAVESSIPAAAEGYYLKIEPSAVTIAGADDAGLFYGIQTFLQIYSQPEVMQVTITDYPSTPLRGVIEGFYGNPWSYDDRCSQFDFYGANKMNVYVYGPKNDDYHRSQWYNLYPAEQAAEISALVKRAHANRVKFVWAMHPSNSIDTDSDKQKALAKFEQMYTLGVRAFAIFFDDIESESVDNQVTYLNFLTDQFVNKKSDVEPLIVCPTEYNKAWAGQTYLPAMGKGLYPEIKIMWTGNSVVDMIDKADCDWFKGMTKRDPFIWLNFPVNDYGQHNLLMGPLFGPTENIERNINQYVTAYCSNPMQYAEASKVALYSVADYSWNPAKFDNDQAWERAVRYVVPEAPEAFRQFCIDNIDVAPSTHGLRRLNESPEFEGHEDAYFNKMEQAATELFGLKDNPVVNEIREFLQYYKLQAERGITLRYMRLACKNAPEDFIAAYQLYKEKTEAADKLVSRGFSGSVQSVAPHTGTLLIEPYIKNAVGTLVQEFKSSGFSYPADLFPAQVLENGSYYIMCNGRYLSNTDGGHPVFRSDIDEVNPGRQLWIIAIDPETGRYSIKNEWDKRYVNELGAFGTNPYESVWHTYTISRFEGKYSIQNGGSAGNAYWNVSNNRVNKGDATNSASQFRFEIRQSDGQPVASLNILGRQVYILDDSSERAFTCSHTGNFFNYFEPVVTPNPDPDSRQLFTIELDTSVDRYKILNVATGAHCNENGKIGYNDYSSAWNSYILRENGSCFSIQNAGSAGTGFWTASTSETNASVDVKSLSIDQSFRLRLIPAEDYIAKLAITSISAESPAGSAATFDLQGRRVAPDKTSHGIYIQNGKKIIL